MLINVIRLIGAIKNKKAKMGITTRPAHCLLPLSPNHGIFGHDGLYAESKLGLEGLLNKWKAEGWNNYVNIVGAVIGWTRGTALMNSNNIVDSCPCSIWFSFLLALHANRGMQSHCWQI
jgi:fatty acid synthase subunit alpha, fungi type